MNHDLIQTQEAATRLATSILNNYKEARYDIALEDRGSGAIVLADRLKVENSQRNAEYMVTKVDYTWDGTLSAHTEGKFLKEIK
ncbi:hypothetical protein D3C75_989620 [compost metagenome]